MGVVAGFFDGETYYRLSHKNRKLWAWIETAQTGTGGKQLLDEIDRFITKETGAKASRYYYKEKDVYHLYYKRLPDIYKICSYVLPHTRHPEKRKELKQLWNK